MPIATQPRPLAPGFVARHLWRTWQAVGAGLAGGEPALPETTVRRWRTAQASDGRVVRSSPTYAACPHAALRHRGARMRAVAARSGRISSRWNLVAARVTYLARPHRRRVPSPCDVFTQDCPGVRVEKCHGSEYNPVCDDINPSKYKDVGICVIPSESSVGTHPQPGTPRLLGRGRVLYEKGMAPPEFEHVGICVIPG